MSTNLPSYQFMISIHALREEGDSYQQGLSRMWTNFYPRPPRGGRPCSKQMVDYAATISIHALREEGDQSSAKNSQGTGSISIHALREEGDPQKTLSHRVG